MKNKPNLAPKINIIAAIDSQWGISKNGRIPWDIVEDTNYFQDVTKRKPHSVDTENVVIMGKNTWLSLPKVDCKIIGLKDRVNIVVSTTLLHEEGDTHIIVRSLTEAVDYCTEHNYSNIFICGGAPLYKEAFDKFSIDQFYLTIIEKDYKCDNFFPADKVTKDLLGNYCKSFFVKDRLTDTEVEVTFYKYDFNSLFLQKISTVTPFEPENKEELDYLHLLNSIIISGTKKGTRNATTLSLFGRNLTFNLAKGFPLLTTKKVFFKGIVEELLFFLRGDTNTNHLVEKGVNIWKSNTSREFLDSVGLNNYQEGDMGPMNGYQLLHFDAPYEGFEHDYTGKGFNQFQYCIDLLKRDPFSRRIMMTTYNPKAAKEGCLYPCHGISIIFDVTLEKKVYSLSCMMTQRSADMFLGVPFNIASYALLVHLMCEMVNNDKAYEGYRFVPGKLVISLANAHIYESHYSQCIRQILREPYPFPKLEIKKKVTDVSVLQFEDFELLQYQSYPIIAAKMVA